MLKHFFSICHMGGYGIYIWPCYAFLLLVVSWQIFAALRKNILIHNKLKQDLWSGSGSDEQT